MTVAFALEAGADGALRGSVVDRDGAPLAGVNIQVDGTEVGAVTDAEGEFELVVDEGTYSIRASLIGYTTATVDEIGVMPGRTATVEFTLTLEPIELSSTLISASAIGEDVRRAPNRVNIIDRQEIERTLARNIHKGAVYCSKMALAAVVRVMAEMSSTFIAAKDTTIGTSAGRQRSCPRRTRGSSTSPANSAR